MTIDVRRVGCRLPPGLAFLLLAGSVTASVAALGHSAAHEQPADQTATLAPGAERERDLVAGQSHTYELRLDAGQFLHAVVVPHGIDVAVTLIGPDGRELLNIDLAPDQVTPEPVMAVAEMEGRYEITVKSANDGVPAGRYVVRIEALRPATSVDAVRAGAMRQLEAGVRVVRAGTEPQSWLRAVDPLEAAQKRVDTWGLRRS